MKIFFSFLFAPLNKFIRLDVYFFSLIFPADFDFLKSFFDDSSSPISEVANNSSSSPNFVGNEKVTFFSRAWFLLLQLKLRRLLARRELCCCSLVPEHF